MYFFYMYYFFTCIFFYTYHVMLDKKREMVKAKLQFTSVTQRVSIITLQEEKLPKELAEIE